MPVLSTTALAGLAGHMAARTTIKAAQGGDIGLDDAFYGLAGVAGQSALTGAAAVGSEGTAATAAADAGAVPAAITGAESARSEAVSGCVYVPGGRDFFPFSFDVWGLAAKIREWISPEGPEPTLSAPVLERVLEKAAPPLGEQLASGKDILVTDATITDTKVEKQGDALVTTLTVEQKLADASAARLEHVQDLLKRRGLGEDVAISDIAVAAIAYLVNAPFHAVASLFNPESIYAARRGTRTVEIQITSRRSEMAMPGNVGEKVETHDFSLKQPDKTVDVALEDKTIRLETAETSTEIHAVVYRWDEARFDRALPDAAAEEFEQYGTAEAVLVESVKSETTDQRVLTATGNLGGDLFAADQDISGTVRSTEIQTVYYSDESAGAGAMVRDEKRSWLKSETRDIAEDAAAAMRNAAVSGGSPELQAARAEMAVVLRECLARLRSDGDFSREDGWRITGGLAAAAENHGLDTAGPSAGMTVSHSEKGPVRETVATETRDRVVDWGMDRRDIDSHITRSQDFTDTTLQASQLDYEKRERTSGVLAAGGPVDTVERQTSAIVIVQETKGSTLSEHTEKVETKTAFGRDVGGVVGSTLEKGPTATTTEQATTMRVYEVRDHDLLGDIEKGTLREEGLLNRGGALVYEDASESTVAQEHTAGSAREFKSGIISYAPLGQVASIASKSSYGLALSGSDYFWAAADAAVTAATVGMYFWARPVAAAGKAAEAGGKGLAQAAKSSFRPGVASRAKGLANAALGENRFALDKIVKPGLNLRNGGLAGSVFGPERLGALAAKYPMGVEFTKAGYPNFLPYAHRVVESMALVGNGADIRLANKLAGLPRTPLGYVWHHLEDGVRMALIPLDLHKAVPHSGGASLLRLQGTLVAGLKTAAADAVVKTAPVALAGSGAAREALKNIIGGAAPGGQ